MTLSEAECNQKWTEIGQVLKRLETIVAQLVNEAEKTKEAEREEVARLHAVVAYVMTHLEDVKLQISLLSADYKDHNIHVQLGILEKYIKKATRGLKVDEKRSLKVDKDAAKRTIQHHLDPVEQ